MVGREAKQGDILKINLNPTKGHEQAGYRPVLVVNNTALSRVSRMIIACPITNTDRLSPVHIRLDGLITTGFVMCDQVRAIDIQARDYKTVETVDKETLLEVCDIVQSLFDI